MTPKDPADARREEIERIREAAFAALGWSTWRYNETRPVTNNDYRTFELFPPGLVSGDIDHDDWLDLAERLYDAGLRAMTGSMTEASEDVHSRTTTR